MLIFASLIFSDSQVYNNNWRHGAATWGSRLENDLFLWEKD